MRADRVRDLATASIHFLWDDKRDRWHCYALVRGSVVWSQPIETSVGLDSVTMRQIVKRVESELLAHLPF